MPRLEDTQKSPAASDLHRVLFAGLPQHRSRRLIDRLDVQSLSCDLTVTHQAVYRWLDSDRLPAKRLRQLLALQGSTLTAEALLPFLAR